MTRPQRFLSRMVLFLLAVAAAAVALAPGLESAFLSNVILNGMILAVLLLGIIYSFQQVFLLRQEVDWIEAYRRGPGMSVQRQPRLLAPVATMLGERHGRISLSTLSLRSLLDSISARLDESRDISRYLIGLLIFLGLLGTFWGLLQTVDSVGQVVSNLSFTGSNLTVVFEDLKRGLSEPLSGMGTAFSSSLFGLAGSLILGFLDLQAGQAQNRFYNDLEEWLSGLTRLSSPGFGGGEGETSVPAYLQALIEQTADSLDKLQRSIQHGEENRRQANTNLLQLTEKLSTFTDQMKAEQSLMLRIAEGQMEMKPILSRLADANSNTAQESSLAHIRNIEIYLARLLEDLNAGRSQSVEEVRSEIRLLARTIAAVAEESHR